MNKENVLILIKRLVQKGEISSAEVVCYDYNIDLSYIEECK